MRLFGKKEENDEQSSAPANLTGNAGRTESSSANFRDMAIIQKDLETMKAMVSTLREMKKDDQEKFAKTSEQIGELRSTLLAKEKEIKEIGLKVAKAIDLVETAQVEKVLVEKKKEDAKIQMLEAKVESYHGLSENLLSELKDLKLKLAAFRGLEEVAKLHSEVKLDLANINHVKSEIERHADKIESMFVDFNKKFDDFKLFKIESEKLKDEIRKTLKDIYNFNLELVSVARKEDLAGLEKDIMQKLRFAEEYKGSFDKLVADMAKIKDEIAQEKREFSEWHAKVKEDINVKTGFTAVKADVKKMETMMYSSMKRLNMWINYFQDKLNKYEMIHDIRQRKVTPAVKQESRLEKKHTAVRSEN